MSEPICVSGGESMNDFEKELISELGAIREALHALVESTSAINRTLDRLVLTSGR